MHRPTKRARRVKERDCNFFQLASALNQNRLKIISWQTQPFIWDFSCPPININNQYYHQCEARSVWRCTLVVFVQMCAYMKLLWYRFVGSFPIVFLFCCCLIVHFVCFYYFTTNSLLLIIYQIHVWFRMCVNDCMLNRVCLKPVGKLHKTKEFDSFCFVVGCFLLLLMRFLLLLCFALLCLTVLLNED